MIGTCAGASHPTSPSRNPGQIAGKGEVRGRIAHAREGQEPDLGARVPVDPRLLRRDTDVPAPSPNWGPWFWKGNSAYSVSPAPWSQYPARRLAGAEG